MELLGERLRRLRKAKKLTQVKLAMKAGVAQSTIVGIEKGHRSTKPSSLIQLAHALEVDAYYLKTGLEKKLLTALDLDENQRLILEAFPLLSEDVRNIWLDSAKKALNRHTETKNKAA